jgi:hypothetical protein
MEKRPFTFDEAEYRLRRVLAEEGYAQPGEVRQGPGRSEITLAWEGHERPITMDLAACPERLDRIEQPIEGRPATVAEVTAKMSKIISDAGLRKPDAIQPGPERYEVSFIWVEEKLLVIVDRREEVSADVLEAA